jgi:hypothetical protein
MQTPPSQPPSAREAELAVAIQQFWTRLQMASAYDPASQDAGRSSARIALIAVMDFLAVLYPKLSPLPLALQDLLQGLTDLDRGTVISLLRPSKKRGRRPKRLSDELFRAIAAAAMTSLMKSSEMDRDLAARNIARRLNEMGYGPGRLTAVQLAKWREKMMTERAAENLAVQRYELALKCVQELEPAEAARFLLSNLPILHPMYFPSGQFPSPSRPSN